MAPPSPNPYVKAAMADTATAQIITKLSELLADETRHNHGSHTKSTYTYQTASEYSQTSGGYVSAVDASAPNPPTSSPGYVSAATSKIAHQPISYPAIASDIQAVKTEPAGNSSEYISPTTTAKASQSSDNASTSSSTQASSSYLSPQASWELEKQQKQQAQVKAEQRAQQRYQQEQQAKRFLAKLSKLDPLEGTRMWFEDFAKLCPSRLDAAIEFLATVPAHPS